MKITYRIESSRPNEAPQGRPDEIVIEATTQEECDQKAIKHLEELGAKEGYAWDNLSLERVDVVEKTTHIARNEPEDHTPGSPRYTTLRGQKPRLVTA